MNTIDPIAIVRSIVGRRHKISRAEMRAILAAIAEAGLSLDNDCVRDPSPRWWSNACTDITCISVMAVGAINHGAIRYDQPGQMAPTHMAQVMFAPAALLGREYDPIDYLRRHARRLLIVRDDPPLPDPVEQERLAAEADTANKARNARLRRLQQVAGADGTWVRVLEDGMLERRDPNDGQSSDPSHKHRHQYRITEMGDVVHRRLPPESVGDAYADIGVPEWEPIHMPPRDPAVYGWWREQVM